MKNNDSQSNKYQLTINNPKEFGYSHDKIFELFRDNFKTLEYLCMADEQGNTHHTHIFVCFSSRVRFSKMKRYFPEAHIERVKGRVSDNVNYIKKTGKWENDEKHGTKIEGSFEEWGERPSDSKGKRSDMTALYDMVENDMSIGQIIAENQDYILIIDKIGRLTTELLMEKHKEEFRDLKVIYIYGETGTGKTSGVMKKHGAKNIHRITDYDHPFDSYRCQSVVVFDEFRNSIKLEKMLNYCEGYPLELPARYYNKYACYDTVYIISNWKLEKQYINEQKDDKESWFAFLRRINEVHVYSKSGIIKYSSVSDYLKRKEDFHTITESEQLKNPFK